MDSRFKILSKIHQCLKLNEVAYSGISVLILKERNTVFGMEVSMFLDTEVPMGFIVMCKL